MKQFIENFCNGMYDSLNEQQKKQITYQEIEKIMSSLIPAVISKLIMVILALIVSIPFLIKFHVPNAVGMWVLEMCLWIVWIKETTNWKDYRNLLKRMQETK